MTAANHEHPEVHRHAIVYKMGESGSSIKTSTDDYLTDDFFELNLQDVKRLHADNIRKAREAEEGAQVILFLPFPNFCAFNSFPHICFPYLTNKLARLFFQLLTQQLRDAQAEGMKLNLLNKYKKCIIRIQFPKPDCLVLQGVFLISESISDVIQFVEKFLQVRLQL